MLAKAAMFKRPALLSLTVARDGFADAKDAHERVTAGRFIPRLLRLLGVKLWLWVLEFQTDSGSGWPHWHILIDLDHLPKGRVDLKRAWHLWRDKWSLGGLDLSVRKSFDDPVHAMLYLTKYLTKSPDAFPIWVIMRDKAIRFVQGCRALGSLTGQPTREAEPTTLEEGEQLELKFRQPRTVLLVRMAKCGMSSAVFGLEGDCETGEGTWTWMGNVSATVDDVCTLAEQGLISARVAAIDWGEGELVVITGASVGGVVASLRRMPGELADRECGYTEEWHDRLIDRQGDILDRHGSFWDLPAPRGKAKKAWRAGLPC
jgi:hypothetical protein